MNSKKQSLTVSALIPTYNRREQVMRAINSALAQTVRVDEIIVVDDGSSDGTSDAIRDRYGSRVTLITQTNAGVSAARNRGISEARGEWIAFLDSDDIWMPEKIERQLQAVTAMGNGYGLCFTDCAYEENSGKKLTVFEKWGFAAAKVFGSLEYPAQYIVSSTEPFWTPSLLIRRSLLNEAGRFNQTLLVREDTDVMFRLTFKTKFCYVAEPLVRIDRNPSRDGLCNLFDARDDRIHECMKHLYSGWLAIPEVTGSRYENVVRDLLRLAYYNSAECKMHRLRIAAALREIGNLRALGDSYSSIAGRLLSNKLSKLRRTQPQPTPGDSHPNSLGRPGSTPFGRA